MVRFGDSDINMMNKNVVQRYGDQSASKWDKKNNSKFIRIADDSCSYKCALYRYN